MIQVYEIPNTFTRDLPLDEQIALGINDWRAERGDAVAFGHTRTEAIFNLPPVSAGRCPICASKNCKRPNCGE